MRQRKNSRRGTEVGAYPISYRDSKEASATIAEWAREKQGHGSDQVERGWRERITWASLGHLSRTVVCTPREIANGTGLLIRRVEPSKTREGQNA